MLLVGRTFDINYRYGFNGKEHDTDPYGQDNVYDYGYRIYNPRLGKFLSVDPLSKTYPWYTPYQFAGNKPICFIDRDGLEPAEPGTDLEFRKAPILGNEALGEQNWVYFADLGGWQLTCVDKLVEIKTDNTITFELEIFLVAGSFGINGGYTLFKIDNIAEYPGQATYWETSNLIKHEFNVELPATIKFKKSGTIAVLGGEITIYNFTGNSLLNVLNDPLIIEETTVSEGTGGIGVMSIQTDGYKDGVLVYSYTVYGTTMGTPSLQIPPGKVGDQDSQENKDNDSPVKSITYNIGNWHEQDSKLHSTQDSLNRAHTIRARTRNPNLNKEANEYIEENLDD